MGPDPTQPGVDPSVVAAMQGGFTAAPMDPRAYDMPTQAPVAPQQDSYVLPPPVQSAVMNGFAPQPLPPPQAPADVPVGVIDNGHFVANPPPGFVPQPLADPFPEPSAADKKAQAAAAKAQDLAAKADAQKQAKQAAYAATPQGEDDASVKAQLGINQDQQALAGQQGDLESKQATDEAVLRDKGIADAKALQDKADAAREESIAQQKQMIDQRGKDIEAAAKRTIDPNRMYNSMSTARHIGIGLMTILAGLGQGLARDNGPNPVVKMMTDAQDRDIDAQKAGIEQGNKAIDAKRQLQQDYGHLGDDENAMWQYRKAQMRTMLADQLEASAAHYKSPKALLAAKVTADGLRMEAAKIVGEQAARRQTQQNKDAELANTRTGLGIQGGQLALARDEFKQKQAEFGVTMADKAMARLEAGQQKMAEIEAKKGTAPEGGFMVPTGRTVQLQSGNVVAEHKPLLQQDGTPYIAPKGTEKDLYEREAATKTYIDAIDKVREMREQTGGHINSHSSGARAMAQEMARASLAMHKLSGIARLTPQAMELADKLIAGDDDPNIVDSYIKTVEPQLEQSRADVLRDRVTGMHNFTGDPKQLDIPDPVKSKPAESTRSQVQRELEKPGSPIGGIVKSDAFDPSAFGGDARAPSGTDSLSDVQRTVIRQAVAVASQPQTRGKAIDALQKIIDTQTNPAAFRAAAQAVLETIPGRPGKTSPAGEL